MKRDKLEGTLKDNRRVILIASDFSKTEEALAILDGYKDIKVLCSAQGHTKFSNVQEISAKQEKPQIACRSDFVRSDIGNYGCSFFDNVDMINIVLHMPRKNRRIAKGAIRQEFGPIIIDGAHIMCFLYSDARMETEFEVI